MASNNSINFPNLTTKTTPTTSDIVMISDAAASGDPKQSTIGSLPYASKQLTIENESTISSFPIGIPGMFGDAQSDTQAQSIASTFSSNVVFVPFYLSQSWTMDGFFIIATATVAASSCTGGVYASTTSGTFNNFPTGAPLKVSSVATTGGTGVKAINFASSLALSANTLYWAAFQASTATTLSLKVGPLNIDHPNPISQVAASSLWTANILTYANAYSAGSLPTLTQSSIAITACNYNLIGVGF